MTANEAHVSVSYRFSGSLGTKIEVIILRNKLKASTAQYSDADHKNAKKSRIVFSKNLKFFFNFMRKQACSWLFIIAAWHMLRHGDLKYRLGSKTLVQTRTLARQRDMQYINYSLVGYTVVLKWPNRELEAEKNQRFLENFRSIRSRIHPELSYKDPILVPFYPYAQVIPKPFPV